MILGISKNDLEMRKMETEYFGDYIKKELCDALKKAYNNGWITTRDGNASFRIANSEDVMITPSGVKKNDIKAEEIVHMSISNGSLMYKGNPSGEISMHWLLLQNAMEDRFVLHAHPTNIVAAMYAGLDLQKIASDFPEIYRYTRVGKSVSKLPAVSLELATETVSNLGLDSMGNLSYDIVGQMNHGATSVGRTADEAYEHMERLDHICEIVLKSGVK